MPVVTCVEDMRVLARKRLPRLVYDYVESGSWSQRTRRANEDALARLAFRQRVGMPIATRDTATTLAGQPARMPAAISPMGMCGLLSPMGEVKLAQAAQAFGIPFTLSLASSCSLEQVRAATGAPFWLQISVLKDQDFLAKLIDRAAAAQCSALVLTLDFHLPGQRHADLKNGLRVPPRPSLACGLDMLRRVRWAASMLRGPRPGLGNIIGHARGVHDMASFARWYQGQFELDLHWGHVEWLRKRWPGALIVKGIMDPRDARSAVDAGADAVSVSNHGGRQLDGAPAAIAALAAVVAEVGEHAQVFMDGGIRSGQDMLRACALGADGVLLGRAPLYGLGAQGSEGVVRVLEMMHAELSATMGFCGCTSVRALPADLLWREAP